MSAVPHDVLLARAVLDLGSRTDGFDVLEMLHDLTAYAVRFAGVYAAGVTVLDGTGRVACLHHRQGLISRDETIAQLETALQSRIVIEQAKGVLAARLGIDVHDAFGRLRGHARCRRQHPPPVPRRSARVRSCRRRVHPPRPGPPSQRQPGSVTKTGDREPHSPAPTKRSSTLWTAPG